MGNVRDNNWLKLLIETILMFGINWYMCLVPEEEFEVPRLKYLYCAVIILLLLSAFLRGIDVRDKYAVVYVLLSTVGLICFWIFRGINTDNYGDVYSVVLKEKHVVYVLFVGLIADLFRHKDYRYAAVVKEPLFWLYFVMISIGVFFVHQDVIPLFIPFFAILFTDISRNEYVELLDCFCASYYIVFAILTIKAFVLQPTNFVAGRYVGTFLNTSTTGVLCGIAVLCCIYFWERYKWLNRKEIWPAIMLSIISIYAIVTLLLVGSRTVEGALSFVVLVYFIFLHGKGKKCTLKRLCIGIVMCMLVVGFAFYLGHILYTMILEGRIAGDDLSYGLSHIAVLGKSFPDGRFKLQFLNKINALSSQRLVYWADLAKQARFYGQPDALLYTHNVYLCYMIKYGMIGGSVLIVWTICYLVRGIALSTRDTLAYMFPMIYCVFACVAEMGMNGYWSLPLGFYWCLFQIPLIKHYKD